MISVIPLWKMLMETKGKTGGIAMLLMIPVFVITGGFMFSDGVRTGKLGQAAIGLICVLFFGSCFIFFAPQKKYAVGKSFLGFRSKLAFSQKAIKYACGLVVTVVIVFSLLMPLHVTQIIGYGIPTLFGFYALSRSLRFHEDVDFSVNEYLASALGISTGEKALATYQNFDANNIRKGSIAFIITATKLVIVSHDGEAWERLTRNLNQITHLGIISDQHQCYFVKMCFNDGTDALLRLSLYEKLTSTPQLIIKRLLEAIDASILGGTTEQKTVQRRRVVIGAAEIALKDASAFSPQALTNARNIELMPAILDELRNAKEVVPSRKLEL